MAASRFDAWIQPSRSGTTAAIAVPERDQLSFPIDFAQAEVKVVSRWDDRTCTYGPPAAVDVRHHGVVYDIVPAIYPNILLRVVAPSAPAGHKDHGKSGLKYNQSR
jgi:hypothetical protein